MRTPFAIRIVSVLMSPDFLYRLDLSDTVTASSEHRLSSKRHLKTSAPPASQPLVRLCSGQQIELFPVVQHAR